MCRCGFHAYNEALDHVISQGDHIVIMVNDAETSQSYGQSLPDQVERVACLTDAQLDLLGDVRFSSCTLVDESWILY